MKKLHLIILIAAILYAPYTANAGKDDKVGGIRVGWNTSAMFDDGSKISGTENLQAFYVGVFRDNKIVPLLSLGSGLEYVQNGLQIDSDNKLVLHYISAPVHLKAKIGPVFGLAGIAPSIKVSEKIFENGEKRNPTSDEKSEWFDVPFQAGVGVKILFITIEARYHWGLMEVNSGYRNQYFQLGAAISF